MLDENSQWFYILVCNFFTSKHYRSGCWSRWENLDRGQYPFQPIKFTNLVVPSPCEIEPYTKCKYYATKLQTLTEEEKEDEEDGKKDNNKKMIFTEYRNSDKQ